MCKIRIMSLSCQQSDFSKKVPEEFLSDPQNAPMHIFHQKYQMWKDVSFKKIEQKWFVRWSGSPLRNPYNPCSMLEFVSKCACASIVTVLNCRCRCERMRVTRFKSQENMIKAKICTTGISLTWIIDQLKFFSFCFLFHLCIDTILPIKSMWNSAQ